MGLSRAVETVLIQEAGKCMLHFQGSMTKADGRFDRACDHFKSALPKNLAELTKARSRMIEDGASDDLVAGETAKIQEVEAFIENHLDKYTGKQLQLKLMTMSKMVRSKRQEYQKKGETGRPTQDNDWHVDINSWALKFPAIGAWVKHFGAHAVWGFEDVSKDTMTQPKARAAAAGVAAAAAAAAGSSNDDEEEESEENSDTDCAVPAAAAAAAPRKQQDNRPGLQSLLDAVEQAGGSSNSSGSSKKRQAAKPRKADTRPSKYADKLNYKAGVVLEGLGSIMNERDVQLAQLLGQHAGNTSANYREIGRGFAEGMAALAV